MNDQSQAHRRKLDPVGLDGLCAIWNVHTVCVALSGAAALADKPETSQRIRGAMGRVLYASASQAAREGRPCTFNPPCAYDIFHRVQGKLPNGRDIPMPFVITCDPIGSDLLVTLRLFGRASEWVGELRAALVAGLRSGDGQLSAQTIMAVESHQARGLKIHELNAPIVIEFLTPVMQSRRSAPSFDKVALFKGLAARIAGLAWWHDVELMLDFVSVDASVRRLVAGAQESLRQTRFTRAHRGASQPVGQTGMTGWLRCPPPDQPMSTLLQIGVQTHLGAKTSAGIGRYMLKVE